MVPPSKRQRFDAESESADMGFAAEASGSGGKGVRRVPPPKYGAKGGGPAQVAGDDAKPLASAKAPEPEVDHDVDDVREKLTEVVDFNVPDTTLNTMVSGTGGLIMSINEGGLSYLLAGARANVGIRSGRYMVEARIVELTSQVEAPGQQQRSSLPRNLLRIGVSTAGSWPLMGDTEESVCFDSEGSFQHNKKRTHVSQKFSTDCVVALVINLQEGSPNAMTMTLFKDGVRIADPQPLPDALKGKTLYPTITFKNVSVQVNFGPTPLTTLPFRCRMLQEAAREDVEVTPSQELADGKHSVLFPVCMPDAGTFHWCDWFLSQNPDFAEVSDRKIIDWAVRSGVWRPKPSVVRLCNDRPDMNLGIPALEDGSAKRSLLAAASTQRRNVVIMEVRGNLLQADRMSALRPFRLPHFQRLAWVMAGEPQGDYREHCFQVALKDKQAKANAEFAAKKSDRDRKRYLEQRQKQVEKAKAKMERMRQKMVEEQKRKAEEAAKAAAEGKEDGEDKGEGKDGEEKDEKKEDAKPEDDEDEDEPMPEEKDEEPPKVELTEEERANVFKKKEGDIPDISVPAMMAGAGNGWTFPGQDEGFDAIEYPWQDAEGCEYAMRQWKNERKLTTKVDYIAPSDWFKEKWKSWQGDLQRWHVKHMEFKDPVKRQARKEALQLEKLQKQQAALLEMQAKDENVENPANAENGKAAEVADAPAKDENADDNKDDAMEVIKDEKDEKPEEKKDEKDEKKETSEENGPDKTAKAEEVVEDDPMAVLEEQLAQREKYDVFAIEEILDSNGEGEPLFSNFAFEDWALLSLRFELHLVVHAFQRDCRDPDRTGFPPEHLPYYYNKYFRKNLNPKNYGANNVEELIELVRDTLIVCDKTLESTITDDLETNEVFVKLAEEERRDRKRRIEGGDPKAPLRFSRAPPTDMVLAQAQLKAPPPSRMGGNGVLGGMGAVPKGGGAGPNFDMAMSKSAGLDLALSMPPMPSPMDPSMGLSMDSMGFEAWGKGDMGMGTSMGADVNATGVTPPGGATDWGMGDWTGDGSAAGGDWDASGDWDMGKGGSDYDSFMGKMMDKGWIDKGKGKSKKGKLAMMMKGKKGGGWSAGGGGGGYGDKGGWSKGASAKGAGKSKGGGGGWKGGWKG